MFVGRLNSHLQIHRIAVVKPLDTSESITRLWALLTLLIIMLGEGEQCAAVVITGVALESKPALVFAGVGLWWAWIVGMGGML